MSSSVEGTRIWILGLHHAGTTIVWRAFRKDARFLCFDEPTTGDIGAWFPNNNPKQTHDEYIRAFGANLGQFRNLYEPLDPMQELDVSFTTKQERYLRFLLEQAPNVVIDETHLHLHVPTLAEMTPRAWVVHLHRRASAFATSHLIPSWSRQTNWPRRIARRLQHEYNKQVLWTRYDFLPGMRRDEVIGCDSSSKFALMLAEAGYDADRIMSAPALVRLLAYWHYHYHHLEREGPRSFGERFKSLRYEDFANHPAETMARLYGWIGLPVPEGVDYTEVYPPKPPFRASDRRWREAARIAGFNDEEIVTLL